MSSNVLKTEDSIYSHSFTDNNGNNVELSQFKDNLMLLVNVASNCGFTKQYEGLQNLHEQYGDKGLVVIGFPCNQFGNQEPGTDDEIKEFCQKNYNVTFLMSTKIEVNGENAHPLFKQLTSQADFDELPWNFTKFLIDKNEFRSMGPDATPEQIDKFVFEILANY
jgi:glutathione peroxidase